jgi:hypothetical protein
MEVIKFKRHRIEVCTDIKELTIYRHNKFNSVLLQESGIGSTFDKIIERHRNLDLFLKHERIKEARTERRNLQSTLYNVFMGINYPQRAFACLIYKIDKSPRVDLSDDGITATVDMLNSIGMTQKFLEESLESKKKE